MKNRENYLTISFGDSINDYPIITREKTKNRNKYYLFNKINIFNKKINLENEERRKRKYEHKKLSKQKIVIENFYTSDYLNKTKKYLLVTVSFNNPIIVKYQIKLIKKYIKGSFEHIICDNSNRIDAARKIKEVCKNNNTTYIRINPDIIPNGYSDSHGIALNWVWENILQQRKQDFALLDHDIFPITEQNIEDYYSEQDFWGSIRFRNKNNKKDIWSLWPGFAFYKYEPLVNKKLNFRRYRKFGLFKISCVDTGSANWNCLYSKYDATTLKNCNMVTWDLKTDKEFVFNGNKNSDFEDCIEYFNNKTWLHSINGSEWHESKGKINLVYQLLNKILEDNYTNESI